MKHRKAKSRDGQPSMTGQMLDILRHLRQMRTEGEDFVTLTYPFAHGRTLKGLMERDWIFESRGIDGDVKYKITGRGLDALELYEPNRQRRDGICPRCGIRPRHVAHTGRRMAFCVECERARGRRKRVNGKANGDITRPCSRCKKRPRLQYPGGHYSSYCHHCAVVMHRRSNRINQQRLLKQVRCGGSVPLCQHCKKNPRHVSANHVCKYCLECQNETLRKTKLRRVLRQHGVHL